MLARWSSASSVTFGVTDLARARSFMRRWAGAAHSSLTRRSASSKLVAWSWGSGPRSGATARPVSNSRECSAPEEVAVVLADAEQAGGKIVRPAAHAEWGGLSGAFADPDGYVWEVAHNPGWTITDDGSIRI